MTKTDALRTLLPGVTGGTDTAPLFAGEALELRFGDAPPVNLELNQRGGLTLYSFLAAVPGGDAAARRFLVNVLELNQPGFLDDGAFFSVHEENAALLAVLEYEGMSQSDFKERVERFAAQAGSLRGELLAFAQKAERENPDATGIPDDDDDAGAASPGAGAMPGMPTPGWLSV